jgi:hypothetical protein
MTAHDGPVLCGGVATAVNSSLSLFRRGAILNPPPLAGRGCCGCNAVDGQHTAWLWMRRLTDAVADSDTSVIG